MSTPEEEVTRAVLDGDCHFPVASDPTWCATHDHSRTEDSFKCGLWTMTLSIIRAHDAKVAKMGLAKTTTSVRFLGGPFDGSETEVTGTPRRIQAGAAMYEKITDPDTGEFLGAYAYSPGGVQP